MNKWKTKYVKLTIKDLDSPWYMKEKDKDIWGIVAEIDPGRWKIVYSGHKDFNRSSPIPLDIQSGGRPNLGYFDYEEMTEEEVFLYKV